jgi:hypothetical protein
MISRLIICEFSDDMPCAAALEQSPFQLKQFIMFAVHETKSCAPDRFMPDPAFEPQFVQSIRLDSSRISGHGPD